MATTPTKEQVMSMTATELAELLGNSPDRGTRPALKEFVGLRNTMVVSFWDQRNLRSKTFRLDVDGAGEVDPFVWAKTMVTGQLSNVAGAPGFQIDYYDEAGTQQQLWPKLVSPVKSKRLLGVNAESSQH